MTRYSLIGSPDTTRNNRKQGSKPNKPVFKVDPTVGGKLDAELMPLLNKLNSKGFKTTASNYGPRSTYPVSWVAFDRLLTDSGLQEAMNAVRSHGFTPSTGEKSWTVETVDGKDSYKEDAPNTMTIHGKLVTAIEFT